MTISNVFGLLGGLALFIFGMNLMSDGLKQVAGAYLKKILEKLTANRFIALLVGTTLTALIQSSNAMCVMVVGFVNAGVMQLERSVGILMGAKIGTTMTGQLIAFNITKAAPVIAFIGVVITMFVKKKTYKYIGQIITSLGTLFMGLATMSSSMEPLREVEWFQVILSNLSNPLLGVLVGVLFTVLIQSASASVGVLQAMAISGVISFGNAFFVMIGMNIGASVAPAIASIGGRKDAKRVAAIVVMFESIGMIIFLIISRFIPVVNWIASTSTDPSRQIANANSIFNIATVLLLLPFTNYLVKLSKYFIPGEDDDGDQKQTMKYIGESGNCSATILIEQIDSEIKRMQSLVKINLEAATQTFFNNKQYDINSFMQREETIDFLNRGITDALIKVSCMDASVNEAKHVGNMFHVINDLERIGDHAENMINYANRLIENKTNFSESAIIELHELVDMVYNIFDSAIVNLTSPSQEQYNLVYSIEEKIDNTVDDMKEKHIVRLSDMTCNSHQGMIYIETLTDLERVADHALNIAQASEIRYHHTIRE